MPRKSTLGSADLAVTRFLSGFARHLLAAGLSHAQFTALARIAYFRAASEIATFRNRRVNYSAVAAMTGLTRLQVRELAKQGPAVAPTKPDRLARIIEGWTTDPRFQKSDFSPRRLSIGAKPLGFRDLVRKYGGDIPPRATLREMVRNHLVTLQGQYVQLDAKAHDTSAQGRLRNVSEALTALVGTSRSNADSHPMRSLSREITYSGVSAKGRILLQKRAAESLQAFVAELQAAGIAASIESPPNRRHSGRINRTRVVIISEELDEEG
jgi:hypothetical protein